VTSNDNKFVTDPFTGLPVMADGEQRQRLWTFQVAGGEPTALEVSNGPPLVHDGGFTLWKVVLTAAQTARLEGLLTNRGCLVQVYGQPETDQLKEERMRIMGAMGATAWRTAQCPQCFFYNPGTENTCGLDDWNVHQLEAAMRIRKAAADKSTCPERSS